MRKTLKEIAQLVGGEVVGDAATIVTGVSGIREAHPGDITFLANPKYLPLLDKTRASAIVTGRDIQSCGKPIIRTDNPSLAFVKIVSSLAPAQSTHPKGVHSTAVLGKGVSLGKGVCIGPYAVIDDGANIGDDCIIYAHCFIGNSAKIGDGTLIYPNASIRERVEIGKRCIIHSGAVIGSDGFGFITIEGKHEKIPQSGIVQIGDDVEIGANTAIDRARFDKTVISSGTKIDNLVHIAHNVEVGENALIVAQAGISGSTVIGRGAIIAGQAGLVGHITIGDNAICAAQAGVTKSVAADTMVSGYPAQPHDKALRINACIQNLPRLYETIKELRKKIEGLESKLKSS
jgi:UDP-3-O-[3-hydroxymyristoyl] glucosamine N-acyltransferase